MRVFCVSCLPGRHRGKRIPRSGGPAERVAPLSPQGAQVERRYRLRGRARFLAIRDQGCRWIHTQIILGGLRNDLDLTRCGFIVSGKLGKAAVRNRIRRRLREAVRFCYPHIAPGWDLVWIARRPVLEADWHDIAAAVEKLLRQADLWQSLSLGQP